MNWRRTSRAIIVGVTLFTIGVALVAGHVSQVSGTTRPTATATPPSGPPLCIRLKSKAHPQRAAIKCM